MIEWIDRHTYSELHIDGYYIGRFAPYETRSGHIEICFSYRTNFLDGATSMYYDNDIEKAKESILKDVKKDSARMVYKYNKVLDILR